MRRINNCSKTNDGRDDQERKDVMDGTQVRQYSVHDDQCGVVGGGGYGNAGVFYLVGSYGEAKDMPSLGMNVEDAGEAVS